MDMKSFPLVIILFFILSSCGTIGGAISGAGDDIKSVGDFIRSE